MTTPIALCVITDRKTQGYQSFRPKLQKVSGQVEIIDLNNIDKPIYHGNNYSDKLKNILENCQAILVTCSQKLKDFLDSPGIPSGNKLINEPERLILLDAFARFHHKVILVAFTEEQKMYVPQLLIGNEKPLSDIATIDAKIKARR